MVFFNPLRCLKLSNFTNSLLLRFQRVVAAVSETYDQFAVKKRIYYRHLYHSMTKQHTHWHNNILLLLLQVVVKQVAIHTFKSQVMLLGAFLHPPRHHIGQELVMDPTHQHRWSSRAKISLICQLKRTKGQKT